MRDGVGEEADAGLVANACAHDAGKFRAPDGREGVVGKFDDVEVAALKGAKSISVEGEELACGLGDLVGRSLLPLARWSPLARHLLQRIYGTLISAAPDADAALAVVDEAVERLDESFSCIFCQVMIAVPASIACTEGGRLDQARSWLIQAQRSAATWQGTAWQGAVAEARAHLARAEGDRSVASRLLAEAATLFQLAGQPLDAQRCLDAAGS